MNQTPDLARLRRFALAAGLVLLGYSCAGVSLKPAAEINPLGIPLTIARPELLPLVLALVSVYALARFAYYGLMRSPSPARSRKQLLLQLGDDLASAFPHEEAAHAFFLELRGWYPTVLGRTATIHTPALVQKANHVEVRVTEFKVPKRVRLATWLEQLDYTAPVWVNFCALLVAGWVAWHAAA